MGSKEYSNISKKKLIAGVKRIISSIPELKLEEGTKHYLKLRYPEVFYGRPTYPLNVNHSVIDSGTVNELMKWLSKNKICSKKKFDECMGIDSNKKISSK